ncbi:ribokinase [Labrys sp. LIt4]|uniref:ribokinase n=1 Tax=Labrys sp. LIt4 TaxID=2821355 RepID=UPI001ADF583E|nr:ribokinase [Labrys sp. LIt4]MBP0577961.1 ribokinase [Labrys sp. LIt4]
MAVHVVGNVCVDTTFRLERFPVPGETLNASGHADGVGGKGANQAIAASRTGADVTLWTAVGDDAAGGWIADRLAAENLTCRLTAKPPPTDRSAVLVEAGGENIIVTGSLCAEAFDPLAETDIAARITSGDIVVMQGNLSTRATAACLELARHRGARTILNPSPLPADAGKARNRSVDLQIDISSRDYSDVDPKVDTPTLPLADIVIVNEGEARTLTRCGDPAQAAAELLRQGAGVVLVTLGSRGCLIAEDETGSTRRLPAPSVIAVDTSGAGDVFCGVFAGGIDLGMTPADAASLAIAAAAIAVSRNGTSDSCPSTAEIGNLIRTLETEKP